MASSYKYDRITKKLVPADGITDPVTKASTQGVGQAAPGVVKPGVGAAPSPSNSRYWDEYAGGNHINNSDMSDAGTGGSPEYLEYISKWKEEQEKGSPKDEPTNDDWSGGTELPYDLGTTIGDYGYAAPGTSGGAAVDPRIAQYQQQLQGYLDMYNQPVSYEKTWGDLAYEDLIRQALGMNYTDWTQGDAYAALRDRYTENGRNAMLDTLGQISARTGGLASSYASAASAQQYNEYMKLLEDAARDAYNQERGYVIENAGLAQGVGNQEYNRWMDIYGLNADNRDRAVNLLQNMLGYAYDDDALSYNRGLTAQDDARDRIAQYLGNGGSIGDLDPALITASGLTTPELTKLEAAYQTPAVSYTGGGGGSGSGTRSKAKTTAESETAQDTGSASGWDAVEAWVAQHGSEDVEDYIKANRTRLGLGSSDSAALAGWRVHLRETGQSGTTEQPAVQMTEQEIRASIQNQTQTDANGNILVEIQGYSPYGGTRYLTLAELQKAVENGQVREDTKNGKQVYTWNH